MKRNNFVLSNFYCHVSFNLNYKASFRYRGWSDWSLLLGNDGYGCWNMIYPMILFVWFYHLKYHMKQYNSRYYSIQYFFICNIQYCIIKYDQYIQYCMNDRLFYSIIYHRLTADDVCLHIVRHKNLKPAITLWFNTV